jgi:hypothetical protein
MSVGVENPMTSGKNSEPLIGTAVQYQVSNTDSQNKHYAALQPSGMRQTRADTSPGRERAILDYIKSSNRHLGS